MAVDVALAERLLGALDTDLRRDGRLGKVRRYLKGDHDLPYMPRGARAEFVHLARQSVTNLLPGIPDTFVRSLHVDGYRAATATDNAAPWHFWQANGLDARQSIAHRGALEYGTSYVLVLPGDRWPVIRPLSPLRSLAWYDDPDDEYPRLGLVLKGTTTDGSRVFQVIDPEDVTTFVVHPTGREDAGTVVASVETHGTGVVPMVRFRDRLDEEAVGVVAPHIVLQDRTNGIVFSTMIALQYASFRQRWATGLAIPVDEDEDSPTFGEPVEPFQAAVDRLWVSDSPEARFGDFAQTDISGHLALYKQTVETLASSASIPATSLMSGLANPPSAEAFAAYLDATQRRLGEFETNFGESWEQVFRLAAHVQGDAEAAADYSAQVRWRDREANSYSATVDALGKIAQMLQVPVEGLWERIPGVTDQDVAYWRALREEGDPLTSLVSELSRQTTTSNSRQVTSA